MVISRPLAPSGSTPGGGVSVDVAVQTLASATRTTRDFGGAAVQWGAGFLLERLCYNIVAANFLLEGLAVEGVVWSSYCADDVWVVLEDLVALVPSA